ncbi:MAG: hypothetical protein KDA75_10160 [Planctomycetaceae bacterium]|nr:hypothetical protein [Planctomycetaceae bacterium]
MPDYPNATCRLPRAVPGDLARFWCGLILCGTLVLAGDDAGSPRQQAQTALARLNVVVGDWRGVGQPRRNSNQGAWTETSGWVWDLQGEQPALVQTVANGKLLQSMRLQYDVAAQQYILELTPPEGTKSTYRGSWDDGELVLVSSGDARTPSRRLTITPRSDIRLVVLHEATEPGKELFFRVAEVGYTRKGRRLAGSGGGQPQCVVTGGLGTIEVQHAGKTYYVCCSGCKQAFEDDPEGILAEYRERLKKEQAEQGS